MSILRLPAVFAVTYAMHLTITPPNPPPHESECRKVSTLEAFTIRFLRAAMAWVNALPSIAETAVILALRIRPAPLSAFVLSVFTRSTDTSRSCAERVALTPHIIFALVAAALGTSIRIWCYRELGRLYTFELTLRPNHELVTTGPYAIVRHPAYTGGILALVGFSLAHASPGSWARECGMLLSPLGLMCALQVVLVVFIILERCVREDRLLKNRFGRSWEVWKQKVGWRLLPGVF
ncbi:hypothetical protein BV22DRAFT_457915 [Leucogyrophana mollusca]|uniref:Uncharacterized protein n=1 Tax=Leucogyrophana mollusca TaxID=85980 RepID=A0ACB8BI14_9AGAM|nr:hypothetical protein BV22DRAFT_457915 [Leucogyrophana mollusca]